MRMKRTQIRLEAGGEDCFLNAFVKLEKMRVAGAHTDPDNLRPAFCRESSETGDWKKKRFPTYGLEFFREGRLSFRGHLPAKGQSQMHLSRLEPAHASNLRVEPGEGTGHRFGKLDADEEAFGVHFYLCCSRGALSPRNETRRQSAAATALSKYRPATYRRQAF